jgi:hypothetical protein
LGNGGCNVPGLNTTAVIKVFAEVENTVTVVDVFIGTACGRRRLCYPGAGRVRVDSLSIPVPLRQNTERSIHVGNTVADRIGDLYDPYLAVLSRALSLEDFIARAERDKELALRNR